MWITIKDKDREYNLNLKRVTCFGKMTSCHESYGIELIVDYGAINLLYYTEEERDEVYEKMKDWLQAIRIGA